MSATSKLGSLLRRLRKEKNLTQEALSAASGISRVQIAYLETGKRGGGRIGWDTMMGMARAFDMNPEEFAKILAAEKPAAKEPKRKTDVKPKRKKGE